VLKGIEDTTLNDSAKYNTTSITRIVPKGIRYQVPKGLYWVAIGILGGSTELMGVGRETVLKLTMDNLLYIL